MKNILYKKAFLRAFDQCGESEKALVIQADNQIRNFYLTHKAPYGLRIKRLFDKGEERTYEARVTDKLRILFVESPTLIAFAFLGNHEQVRRYIKSFN